MPEQNAKDVELYSNYQTGFRPDGFNSVIRNAREGFFKEKIIKATFDQNLRKLPTATWLKTMIETDQERWNTIGGYSFERSLQTSAIRGEYVKNSFTILTDEFLREVVSVIQWLGVSKIVDLCAGPGWLSHWLKVYGLEVEAAVDNKTWPGFEGRYLPLVEKADSLEYVKAHPDIDLFLLSWPPYNNDLASRIWVSMREGTYLLYIGESSGGCTGDDDFFNVLPEEEPETVRLQGRFISFCSIHDRPELYRKKREGS